MMNRSIGEVIKLDFETRIIQFHEEDYRSSQVQTEIKGNRHTYIEYNLYEEDFTNLVLRNFINKINH